RSKIDGGGCFTNSSFLIGYGNNLSHCDSSIFENNVDWHSSPSICKLTYLNDIRHLNDVKFANFEANLILSSQDAKIRKIDLGIDTERYCFLHVTSNNEFNYLRHK